MSLGYWQPTGSITGIRKPTPFFLRPKQVEVNKFRETFSPKALSKLSPVSSLKQMSATESFQDNINYIRIYLVDLSQTGGIL